MPPNGDVLDYMERPQAPPRDRRVRWEDLEMLAPEDPERGQAPGQTMEDVHSLARSTGCCGCYCHHSPACPPCECQFHNPFVEE
jgi:hypothetical protein